MGYACPVCGTPQADATHLANHLAFTALVRGGEHGDWLDERCPGWEQAGEADLAERVVEYAEEEPFPDGATDRRDAPGDGDPDRDRTSASASGGHSHDQRHGHEPGETDADAVIERARELTRRRRANRDAAMDDRDATADGHDDEGDDG